MKKLQELTQETNHQTRFLFASGYWDGPINGLMLWEGKMCWFQLDKEELEHVPPTEEELEDWRVYCKEHNIPFKETDCVEYERHLFYKVYELPKNVLNSIVRRNTIFETFVGTHMNYDENNNRMLGAEIGNQGEVIRLNNLKPYFLHWIWYRFFGKITKAERLDLSKYKVVGEFER